MKNKILITTVFISLIVFIFSCAANHPEQKQNKLRRFLDKATPIEKYKLEVAYQVNKNWIFISDKNSESSQITSIAFKIMPNGEIKGINFVKRSGNEVLDQSAFNAIVKTNPTRPFPPNINKPFVEMGLRFSPNVVK